MKRLISFLAVLALIGSVIGQEEQKKGGTLEDLSDKIGQFNDITARNTEIIKGIPGLIEEQYKRQTGTIIVGTSIFLLAMYMGVFFFDRLRKIRKKKSHEEYIKDLEDRLTLQGSAYIQQLKEHDHHATQLLTEIYHIRDSLKYCADNQPTQKKQIDKQFYILGLLVALGGLFLPQIPILINAMVVVYLVRALIVWGK